MTAPLHVTDEVPSLLTGDASAETVRSVARHLRTCSDCRDDLVDAVVAHATLASARRFAPDVATGGRLPLPERLAQAADLTPSGAPVDLAPVFAQIRAEAASSADTAAPTDAPTDEVAAARKRHRLRSGLLAAAAVVVVGGGGSAVAVATLGGSSSPSDTGREVTVSAYSAGHVDASARIGDGWLSLDASSLPSLPSDQFYEAWLVRTDGGGVMALGPLGSDGTARYTVPSTVMSTYGVLQVTVQQNNGDPAPSATSVLRGTF